jgi:hypothetical protein
MTQRRPTSILLVALVLLVLPRGGAFGEDPAPNGNPAPTSKSTWEIIKEWVGLGPKKGVLGGGKLPGDTRAPAPDDWTFSEPLQAHGQPAWLTPAELGAAWGAVPGAASYRVQVRDSAQARELATVEVRGATRATRILGEAGPTAPGCEATPVEVRVYALDEAGACLRASSPLAALVVSEACETQREAAWSADAEQACRRAKGEDHTVCVESNRVLAAAQMNHVGWATRQAADQRLSSPDGSQRWADVMAAATSPGAVAAVPCPTTP